jgi:hypothetical protein
MIIIIVTAVETSNLTIQNIISAQINHDKMIPEECTNGEGVRIILSQFRGDYRGSMVAEWIY